VRLAVAQNACDGIEGEAATLETAQILIRLMGDEMADIRDWATFALGSRLEIDSPEVRSALASRLDDEDFETRWEAIVGLALRKDPRASEPIRQGLRSESVPLLALDAAAALADRGFLADVTRLRDEWQESEPRLEAAIEACRK
jgi:HEAT repeat protein